ncbi:MAG: FkbM family methyltransferase [Beijerinckiaceae bacterium]|nr:FkbM family methyltransferase [Beijerinckiaceae bacterium]
MMEKAMASRSSLLRNLATVSASPAIGAQYALWRLKTLLLGQRVTKTIRGSVKLGGFSGFSEYILVDQFLSDGEYRFLQEYEFADGAFIDIGANVGVQTIVLAQRYPDRKIYAVEASPPTMKTLRENVVRNRIENVICIEGAMSDAQGEVSFNADPVSRGTASIVSDSVGGSVKVAALTVDNLVKDEGISKIAAIKMDVEGFETLVLRGASETLTRMPPPIIIFEVCPAITLAAGFDPSEPIRLLASAGYEMFLSNELGELQPVEPARVHLIKYENWIALRR